MSALSPLLLITATYTESAGSLTTVSTFIGELYALPPVPYGYVYGIASLGTTQAALILVNGLYQWLG